jgi:hypothetical protein
VVSSSARAGARRRHRAAARSMGFQRQPKPPVVPPALAAAARPMLIGLGGSGATVCGEGLAATQAAAVRGRALVH